MKLFVMAGAIAASLAVAQSALAADLPRRMPVKAPPVVAAPVFTWTGCYIGAHGGYAWGNKKWYDSEDGIEFASHDVDGWLVGGQVGCQVQNNQWVIGVEGQAAWADIKGSSSIPFGIPGGPVSTTDFHSKVDIIGSIALRLGYAVDRTLFFAKGGLGFARDHHWINQSGTLLADTDKEMRWGWMVGAGIEYAFTPNWSIKGEYNYMHFGKKGITFTSEEASVDIPIKQHIHLVKFGINYRFGPQPVVARY